MADALTGPYTRNPVPLLQTPDLGLTSPGGASVYWDARHVVFHANAGDDYELRQMYVGQIGINGDQVSI